MEETKAKDELFRPWINITTDRIGRLLRKHNVRRIRRIFEEKNTKATAGMDTQANLFKQNKR